MLDAVFIVGCSRTGSKIYMNFLKHTPIDITPELHFINPKWLHHDFIRDTAKRIGAIKSDQDVGHLIDLMYSNYFYGSFWKFIDIDRNSLKSRILLSDRSFKSIFKSIIEEHALSRNKKICGAKFPVHVSQVPRLLEWFQNCRIIHIFRDPRAIFASQLLKQSRKSHSSQSPRYLPMLAHTIIQYKLSFKVYLQHKNLNNYYLSRYEDIVLHPQEHIARLCNFLQVPYSEDMLNIPFRDSSFGYKGIGISKKSLYKWKTVISPFSAKLIQMVCWKEMRYLEYN